ncbi:MAG TPA: sigma-E factor negative regulatory protein [Spongiibacteraceae bacterium]|nr:sigma-E factor negative regulatory protein [Spongiibacteraceae bacterium]
MNVSHRPTDDLHTPMIERVRESVSALFDGEADELELRRLITNESSELVHGAWRDYQLQRDALQGLDMRFANLDISARVQAALADEAAPAVAAAGTMPNASPNTTRWWRPLASMAVAASVATVVVIGARSFNPADGFSVDRDSGLVAQTSANMGRVYSSQINPSQNASLGNVAANAQPFGPLASGNGLPGTVFPRNEVVGKRFPAAQTVAFDADQMAQQRLQLYLLRHAERASMNNGQGVISFAKVSQLSAE